MPVFYVKDHNGRNRFLKYTPQHIYCLAVFYGEYKPCYNCVIGVIS